MFFDAISHEKKSKIGCKKICFLWKKIASKMKQFFDENHPNFSFIFWQFFFTKFLR